MIKYCKKIDKSMFRYGTVIPKEYWNDFEFGETVGRRTKRAISIIWKKKTYLAHFERVFGAEKNRINENLRLMWTGNTELLNEIRKEFIQTYLAVLSQEYAAKQKNKYHITNLKGGQQEVVEIVPVSKGKVEFRTFIRIDSPYDNIFRTLEDRNAFKLLDEIKCEDPIIKSTRWFSKNDLNKHLDAPFVIYYLIDSKEKQIYIGSAKALGDRVKIGRHEIPGWDRFKYEVIHPDFKHMLRKIEYHAIRAFSGFFENQGKEPYFQVSEYKLMNKNWSKKR